MTEPVVTEPVVTDPVVTDPVVTDPVVTDPVVTDPVVKQANPRAVANHSDGKGRDDERASIRGGGTRDPHAARSTTAGTRTAKAGQSRK